MSETTILDVLLMTPGPRGRMGLPAVSWGAPGIGKTSLVEQAAARLNLPLETVILSIREPSDLAGLPVVTDKGVKLEPPAWAKRLASPVAQGGHGGTGLVHLDELSTAAPALQAAALRIVCEGVVGDLELPKGVRILASANPEDQAAGGWSLAAPLANRLLHLEASPPTPEAWGEWMTSGGQPALGSPPAWDPAKWDRAWAESRTAFSAYVRRSPGNLLSVPKTDQQRGRAWPSPRSWELAARAAAGAKTLGAGDGVILRLLQAAVGDGVAIEAWNYFRALDLPDPEQILSGHAQVPLKRSDQTYASLAGVCAIAALPHNNRPERLLRAFEVASDVAEKHADVAAACLRPITRPVDFDPILASAHLGPRLRKALQGPLKAVSPYLRYAP